MPKTNDRVLKIATSDFFNDYIRSKNIYYSYICYCAEVCNTQQHSVPGPNSRHFPRNGPSVFSHHFEGVQTVLHNVIQKGAERS